MKCILKPDLARELQDKLLNDYYELESQEGKNFIALFSKMYYLYFSVFISKIPQQITILSNSIEDLFFSYGETIFESLFIEHQLTKEINEELLVARIKGYFLIGEKVLYWFRNNNYGRFDTVSNFNQSRALRIILYRYAYELYKKRINEYKSTYTYKRSLEDANKENQVIDEAEFDKDFYNIEQGYKLWRKKYSS